MEILSAITSTTTAKALNVNKVKAQLGGVLQPTVTGSTGIALGGSASTTTTATQQTTTTPTVTPTTTTPTATNGGTPTNTTNGTTTATGAQNPAATPDVPIYKKWWFYAIVAAVIGLAFFGYKKFIK